MQLSSRVDDDSEGDGMIERYLSIAEIARQLGLSHAKIRKEISEGRLDAVRITYSASGRGRADYRITETALRDWLEHRNTAA